jgi:hypothetical protein
MTERSDFAVASNSSTSEVEAREAFFERFVSSPIPPSERLSNLGLYLSRQTLSRVLLMNELYQLQLPVHGVIMEFGVRWGQNLALFSSLRGIYEPFNYGRRIIGFDTFSGFPSVSPEDGQHSTIAEGAYGVTDGYEAELEAVLRYHESESPLAHIRKFELQKGDATQTLERYLVAHPETIISMAYFDFDLYEPTRRCLELIRPHLTRGTVLAFDELCWPTFPGETIAVREVLGLDRYAIRRSPLSPNASWLVVD